MPDQRLRPLPLSIPNFEDLRESGRIYVDKTALVCELAQNRLKYFLARPRRFGKSLLVSTFKSLFRHGVRDFTGLAAEALWKDKTYRVLHLDFSLAANFCTKEQFLGLFAVALEAAAADAGTVIPKTGGDPVADLCRFIAVQPRGSLVLLIDECDAPLTSCIDNPKLFHEVKEYLSTLYAYVKSYSRSLRFFFMTGVANFSYAGIFSGFNDLFDISLDPKYGALLGFTEEEIRADFGGYLRLAGSRLGLSEDALLERLRANYGGFCFDTKASAPVFCPRSVLCFLSNPENGFENYWHSGGGQPAVLKRLLAGQGLGDANDFGGPREIPISELSFPYASLEDTRPEALMAQAGFLTIRGVSEDGVALLGYPNAEVTASVARLCAGQLLRGKTWLKEGAPPVSKLLETCGLPEAVRLFDEAISAIASEDFPVTNEAVCRSHVQLLLFGAGLRPMAERHSEKGRSDLEFEAGERRWVLEFKYAKDKAEAAAKLREGIEQMRARRYGETPGIRSLMRAVLVFDESERRFGAFAEVPREALPES